MTVYEIMTINEETRDFYEKIPVRRELLKSIMTKLALWENEVTIGCQGSCYIISIKHGDKTSCIMTFEPQGVLDMLYAIAMYI